MFSIHYGEENLSVVFKSEDVIRVARRGFETCQQISCAIMGNGNVPKGVGIAICSPLDSPSDLLGMELALAKAIKRLTSDKALRARIWEAFHRAVAGTLDEFEAEQDFQAWVDDLRTVPTVSYDVEAFLTNPTNPPYYQGGVVETVPYTGGNVIPFDTPTLYYPTSKSSGAGNNPTTGIAADVCDAPAEQAWNKFNTLNQSRIESIKRELGNFANGASCASDCPICESLREELATLQEVA